MDRDILQLDNYRNVLLHFLQKQKKSLGSTYTLTALAKACRVQKTYLSAVLHGRGQLNSDQVYDACQFLQMSEDESDYTALIHEIERSVSPRRKEKLKLRLNKLLSENLETQKSVAMPEPVAVSSDRMVAFYTDPLAQLVHMFLTIERFRRDPERIADILKLSPAVLKSALSTLEKAQLIEITSYKAVKLLKHELYLPANSPLFPIFRTHLRLKALEKLSHHQNTKDYSFTVLFSSDEKALEKVKAKFFEFLSWTKEYAGTSSSTDVYQLNFDFLRWS